MFDNITSLNALDELFTKLAEMLGVALETVQQNGMEYIMMYGRYAVTIKTLNWAVGVFIIVSIFSWGIGLTFMHGEECLEWSDKDDRKSLRIGYIVCFFIPVIISLIVGFVTFLPYLVSPEIFSIQQALQLLG